VTILLRENQNVPRAPRIVHPALLKLDYQRFAGIGSEV